jgi:hypothetical protein
MAGTTEHLQLIYNYANKREQADTEKLIEAVAQLLIRLDKNENFFVAYINYAGEQHKQEQGPRVRQTPLFSALLQKFELGRFILKLHKDKNEPVQLTDIKLSGLDLGNIHARIIARMLELKAPVEMLDLSNNQLTRTEFNLLCNPIYNCSTLKSYNLENNPIAISRHEGSIQNAMRLLHLVHRNADDLLRLSDLLGIQRLNDARISEFYQLVVKLSVAAFKEGFSLLKLHDSFLLFHSNRPNTEALKRRLTEYQLKSFLTPLRSGDITTLNFAEKRLSYAESYFLKEMIKNNISIEHLDLSGASLSPALIKTFAAALKKNDQITRLDLSDIKLSPDNIAEILATMSASGSVSAITELRLAGLSLGGVSALTSLLNTNKITVLDLEDTDLKDEEIKQIAGYLKQKDCALIALDLTNNKLANVHAEMLAKALKSNTSLTDLALDNNQISDDNLQGLLQKCENNAMHKANANSSVGSGMVNFFYNLLGSSPEEEDDRSALRMEYGPAAKGGPSSPGKSF